MSDDETAAIKAGVGTDDDWVENLRAHARSQIAAPVTPGQLDDLENNIKGLWEPYGSFTTMRRVIRDLRSGQAELTRLRAAAIAGLEAAKLPQSFQPFYAIWPGGVIDHNRAIDALIEQIKGNEQ